MSLNQLFLFCIASKYSRTQKNKNIQKNGQLRTSGLTSIKTKLKSLFRDFIALIEVLKQYKHLILQLHMLQTITYIASELKSRL